jgi:hypothetical protein
MIRSGLFRRNESGKGSAPPAQTLRAGWQGAPKNSAGGPKGPTKMRFRASQPETYMILLYLTVGIVLIGIMVTMILVLLFSPDPRTRKEQVHRNVWGTAAIVSGVLLVAMIETWPL